MCRMRGQAQIAVLVVVMAVLIGSAYATSTHHRQLLSTPADHVSSDGKFHTKNLHHVDDAGRTVKLAYEVHHPKDNADRRARSRQSC